jgi:uncharacterized protein YfaS (alpha-2-macroglobulin family)
LGKELLGNASFHGSSTLEVPFSAPATRLVGNQGPLSFSVTGSGKLFYTAELRYASATLPTQPDDSGFSVQRLLRALKPKDLPEAQKSLPGRGESKAEVNDLVMVDVLFETAEAREQIVLDDPLPAGLEPIDFALDTSSMHSEVSDGPTNTSNGLGLGTLAYGAFRGVSGLHRELHDDRVLTFLSHVEPGIYHFRYLVRATTPGRYVVPPLRAQCMYSPEVSGRTSATAFEVVNASRAQAGSTALASAR